VGRPLLGPETTQATGFEEDTMKLHTMTIAPTLALVGALAALSFGQDTSQPATPGPSPSAGTGQGLPRVGIQATAGTLGAGIQAATAVTRRSNVRFGFNYFNYSASTSKDNIVFKGSLRMESAEALYDQYIGAGFHISPGVAIYDDNQATGKASIPGGQSFTLNGVGYYSAAASPVTGTASVTSRKVAPEILFGFGNLLPRSARHFTLNFEMGVMFQGTPNAKLNLTGSTCAISATAGCLPIGIDSLVQSNIQGEQTKINNALWPFRYWPVVRVGFGYKF
jgi:hypothetical protein